MRQTEADLEKKATDQYRDRMISGSYYCGSCGYCLRTLPYVYTCPECGNSYNARPLSLNGIFKPYEVQFPFFDLLAFVLCLPVAVVLMAWGIMSGLSLIIFFGLLYVYLTVLFGARVWRGVRSFIKGRVIIRRIRMEEGP
jgi:hypothetical protein